jgi:hypothetical protein
VSYTPPNLTLPDPMFLSPFTRNSIGPKYRGVAIGQPSSSTVNANVGYFCPFYVTRPYDLQRFWWQNGATVGTDSLQAAIYAVDGSNVLDCTVSTARTLSAGTANHLQFATCAVAAHTIASASDTTGGTSLVTTSVTLKARPGLMYAMFVNNSKASAADAVSSIANTTGGTVTFTSRVTTTLGGSTEARVSMWTCVPTTDVTDTFTITFGASQTGIQWALVAFTNVDTATNHGIVQTKTATGNSTTPSVTLDNALGSTSAMVVGAHGNVADTTTTPGTGWLELYDINYATPTTCMQVEVATNDNNPDGTITSGQWGSIAAEVKNLGTTAVLAPGRYYFAIACTGTTATVFRISSASVLVHTGLYNQSSLTIGLPLTPTLATSNGVLPNFGITNRATP